MSCRAPPGKVTGLAALYAGRDTLVRFASLGRSTRLITPPSDSNTWSRCTSLTVTPGTTSALVLTACGFFPFATSIATLSAGSLAITTPVN